MAAVKFGGVNGDISVAGVGGDLASWDLEVGQAVDDATGYSDGSDAYNAGSGVRNWSLDFAGFAQKGAAGTTPGLALVADAAVAVVATAADTCTYTGNFVLESIKISTRKIGPSTPISGRAKNQGTVAEAWDEGS